MVELEDDVEHKHPTTIWAKQFKIIMALCKRIQVLLLNELCMRNQAWTDQWQTMSPISMFIYKVLKIIVILWDSLGDFIVGEKHHPLYLCNYIKRSKTGSHSCWYLDTGVFIYFLFLCKFINVAIRQNLPYSLKSLCANNVIVVLRSVWLPWWVSNLNYICHSVHVIYVLHVQPLVYTFNFLDFVVDNVFFTQCGTHILAIVSCLYFILWQPFVLQCTKLFLACHLLWLVRQACTNVILGWKTS